MEETIDLLVQGAGEQQKIRFLSGENLLDALRNVGVYISAPCGGQGRCGKCRVRVIHGNAPVSSADGQLLSKNEIEEGVRLACTLSPSEALTIEILAQSEDKFDAMGGYSGAEGFSPSLETKEITLPKTGDSLVKTLTGDHAAVPTLAFLRACSDVVESGGKDLTYYTDENGPLFASAAAPLYGIGIDIGTTTLAFELVELATGRAVGRHSAINRQRAFGGDVISRIARANEGDGPAMAESIRGQISEGTALLCERHDVHPARLVKMAIGANTTMLHLLLGLSCKTLGAYPFTPVTLERVEFRYGEIFEGDFDPLVTLLPGISTYVGADISAGLLFAGLDTPPEKPALLVDIGTNGEMALVSGGRILCTSTAAGPAFEGGNIAAGTGSVPGAICAARLVDGALAFDTIGDEPVAGICGTGVIDIVAASLAGGWLAPSGRYAKTVEKAGLLLATDAAGREIRFTQKDVRELQFAKSALRTGIDLLIEEAGLTYGDIGTVYLAGGFGYRINVNSAVGIGLLPEEFRHKTVTLGNASLGGAVHYLLNAGAGEALRRITAATSEFSLSENARFNDLFIENSAFPGEA